MIVLLWQPMQLYAPGCARSVPAGAALYSTALASRPRACACGARHGAAFSFAARPSTVRE